MSLTSIEERRLALVFNCNHLGRPCRIEDGVEGLTGKGVGLSEEEDGGRR